MDVIHKLLFTSRSVTHSDMVSKESFMVNSLATINFFLIIYWNKYYSVSQENVDFNTIYSIKKIYILLGICRLCACYYIVFFLFTTSSYNSQLIILKFDLPEF